MLGLFCGCFHARGNSKITSVIGGARLPVLFIFLKNKKKQKNHQTENHSVNIGFVKVLGSTAGQKLKGEKQARPSMGEC